MKIFKSTILLTAAVITILSCQKELSFDNGGVSSGILKKDATGNCLPVVVNGTFIKDSVLSNNNFVDIQVTVSTPGTFDIKSDTINGYFFSKNGSVVFGANTIRLYASGKPAAKSTNTFTIKYGNSTCTFNITVTGPLVPAAFTLGGSPNGCTGATVAGTYKVGVPLTTANTLTVQVTVNTPGDYIIGAATTAGFLFTGTGFFTTTGLQTVTLNGTGTPLTAGIAAVTVTSIASTCTFNITVEPAVGGTPAVFTLDGAPNACTNFAVAGTYTVGSVTAAGNTVKLNVTVQTAGTYTITTNTVNGISFSGTGNLAIGPQIITLTATGTPVATGIFNTFKPNIATSCNFSVTCVAAPPLNNNDYVPETAFTNFSDKLVGGAPGDTSYVQVSPNTIVKNAITYKIFEVKFAGVPVDSFYHHKNGGMYYELFDDSFGFDKAFNTDGLLLDSSLAVNATWDINLGANTIGGQPATGKIKALITAKGASATVAGNNYVNVIKVKYSFTFNAGAGGDIEYGQLEAWYAKGKGVIYQKINDVPVTGTDEYETTRIQVF